MTFEWIWRSLSKSYAKRPNVTVRGIEHLPKHEPYIIAANHVGFIEPVVLALFVYRHTGQQPKFLTKHIVYRKFRLFGITKMLGLIDIPPKKKADSLREANAALERKDIVIFFPEGMRNPAPRLMQGKTGMIRAAMASNVPIVPLGYRGPGVKGRFASFMVFWKRDINVQIVIGRSKSIPWPEREIDENWLHEQTRSMMKDISDLCGKPYDF